MELYKVIFKSETYKVFKHFEPIVYFKILFTQHNFV